MSNRFDIFFDRFAQNVLDHPPAKLDRLEEVDLSPEDLAEFLLSAEERKASGLRVRRARASSPCLQF
ncbi:MAG: hypothetical protein M3P29_06860 [Acidobacteriota bacterium]|nr:hypothetical protein [Acidobacteriota bacterium]